MLGRPAAGVDGVFFCEAAFNPISTNCSAIRFESQVVIADGQEFLWLDGIDFEDPVLLPLNSFSEVKFLGCMTDLMDQYARQIEELAVSEDLSEVSPTVLLRAARSMAEEGWSSSEALDCAQSLSQLLLELDELDRRFMETAVEQTMAAVRMYA